MQSCKSLWWELRCRSSRCFLGSEVRKPLRGRVSPLPRCEELALAAVCEPSAPAPGAAVRLCPEPSMTMLAFFISLTLPLIKQ